MQLDPSRHERVEAGFSAQEEWGAPQTMHDEQLSHFVECICSGQPSVPDGEVGLVNMHIVDAACASARRDEVVWL